MKLALARQYCLLELLALLDYPGGVFLVHAGEDGVELLGVALGDGAHGALILGRGIAHDVKLPVAALLVEGIAGAHVLELDGGADIAGEQGVDGCLDLAAHTVELGQALA